jgi:hypothetical protein
MSEEYFERQIREEILETPSYALKACGATFHSGDLRHPARSGIGASEEAR